MSLYRFWTSIALILMWNFLIWYTFDPSLKVSILIGFTTSLIVLNFLSKVHFDFQEAPSEKSAKVTLLTVASLKFGVQGLFLIGTLFFFTGMSSRSEIDTMDFEEISAFYEKDSTEIVYLYLLDETKSTNEFSSSSQGSKILSEEYEEIKDKLINELPEEMIQNINLSNSNSLEFKRIVLAYLLNDLTKKDTIKRSNDEVIVGYLGNKIDEDENIKNLGKNFNVNKTDIQILIKEILARTTNLSKTDFESVFSDLKKIISEHQKQNTKRHFIITIMSDFLDDEWNEKNVKITLNELCKNNNISLEFNFVTIPTRFDKKQENVNQFLEALNETACNCNKIKYDFESIKKQYYNQKVTLNNKKQEQVEKEALTQLFLQLSSINVPTLNIQKYSTEDFKLLFKYDEKRNKHAIINNQDDLDYDVLVFFTSLSNDYKKDALLNLISDSKGKEVESLTIPVDYSQITEMIDKTEITLELIRGSIGENEVCIILYYKKFNQKFLIPIIPGGVSDDPLIQFWQKNI